MRALLAAAIAATAMGSACTSGPSTFALTQASVDPTHWCPGGAKDTPYDLHATIEAHNGTSKTVTIESVNAEMTLASVHGSWLERVGSRYDPGSVPFTPPTLAANSTAVLKITIPSACTSGTYAGEGSSSADYVVTMHVVTSAGAYTITAGNKHEILAA